MALQIEAITMIPALVLAMVAVYISFFALITADPYIKKLSMLFAVSLFFGSRYGNLLGTLLGYPQKIQ